MPRMKDGRPTGGGDGGSFIRQVRLRDDKESCTLRFLTDYDDIVWERFHRVLEGGQFRGMRACVSAALGQACEFCSGGDRPNTLFMAWTYVYAQDHASKPDRPGEFERARVGSREVWRERVEEVRLLQASISHFDALELRHDRYGTLTDRDYEWVRVGPAGTKRPTYSLEPAEGGKGPMTSELEERAGGLPDLEDVALGRVTSLDPDAPRAEERPPVRRVTENDDLDFDPFADSAEGEI